MSTTLEQNQAALIQRHEIKDDFDRAISHLCDWQESLESGPEDDEQEWQELLGTVMAGRQALCKLKDVLNNLPVNKEAWESVYGD